MNLIELTLADGRRIGLPPLAAVIIADLGKDDEEKAATLIRWHIAGQGAQIAKVKDSFRQVVNLFPKSSGGLGWTHAEDVHGFGIAFPEGTIASYEEKPGDQPKVFSLTLGCATGPISIEIRASYDDVQAMLGNPAKPPTKEEAPK